MAATGLLVRYRGKLSFIQSAVVRFIRYDVAVTRFPGTELGMALLTGRIIPVIWLGQDSKALVVCELDGESVAFSGLEPIRSGFFEGDERRPFESGEPISVFPIRDLIEKAHVHRAGIRATVEEDSWMS